MKKIVSSIILLVLLCSCSPFAESNHSLVDTPGSNPSPTSEFITPTVQPSATPTPTEIIDQDCPKVVETIDLPYDVLLYTYEDPEITLYNVETKSRSVFLDTQELYSNPWLSPDGNWMYWVNYPMLIEEQGEFDSARGNKTLHILDNSTKKIRDIILPDEWLTALPWGWTGEGKIKLITSMHEKEDPFDMTQTGLAIIDPEIGEIEEVSHEYNFSKMSFSIHMFIGFAEYHPKGTGVLYTGYDDNLLVYFIDSSGKKIWQSPSYTEIFSSLEGNIWSPDGETAIFFSSLDVSRMDEDSIVANIFTPNGLELHEIKIPTLHDSGQTIFTNWTWSWSSDYVQVGFSNVDIQVGNASNPIVSTDGRVSVGSGFLIDTDNYTVKPLCVPDGYYDSGVFTSSTKPNIVFTSISESGQVTIWLLDIEKWEMMAIYQYSLTDEYTKPVGAISK